MNNHAPKYYVCPICVGLNFTNEHNTLIRHSDVVYTDKRVSVFVASYFINSCDGHLVVVPNEHYENIYDLPDELGAHVYAVTRKMSVVMKNAYNCDGITILQNNEPTGDQHAFHYHLHIFPRYEGDELFKYMHSKRETIEEERLEFSLKN